VLVDLRSPNQFKDGHIAGARNLPGDQIAADPKAVSKLADKTLVLYCDTGTTTAAAQRTLAQAGVKNVFSLRGGLAAWKQENLPVVKG
jgi:rhodanese-related sulfurtransferase